MWTVNIISSVFIVSTVFELVCGTALEDHSTNEIARGLDARNFLTSLATNFISRGYGITATTAAGTGNSQVVSLNLTNLFVLVLLKALIFAAGSLGAGTWKGGYGRSNDGEEKFLTDEEILLFLSFLTGSAGNNGCLQNISCRQPNQSKRYVAAGDILLKAAKLFSLETDINYDYVLQEIEQASQIGESTGKCSKFVCSEMAGH